MYCSRCGTKLPKTAKFCSECGLSVSNKRNVNESNQFVKTNSNPANPSGREWRRKEMQVYKPSVVLWFLLVLISVAFIIITLIALTNIKDSFWDFFGLLICSAVTVGYTISYYKDYTLAQQDFEKYKQKVLEKRDKEKALEEAQRKKEWEINHPICPMCSSRDTYKISTVNRAASVAMVGLASSKIGKQYGCRKCNHKW